ncbi:MAG: flagellar export chaperone FlgN [Rhodospirillales bacterium]|nr:flagellar export chaperone FlgN [Rhodospirillales bacterium]
METNKRFKDMIVISGRLAHILVKENEALRKRKADVVSETFKEKDTLCRAYEARAKSLRENADSLGEVEESTRKELRDLTKKIDELTEENARLLSIGIEVNKRVMDAVSDAVKQAVPGPGTYSAKGTTDLEDVQAAPLNMSVSLNQTL